MNKIVLAIHGGAGTILPSSMTPEKELAYNLALKNALKTGFEILNKGGYALDAVEKAVACLEDAPLFNAGRGSVFTHDGFHEMDASIMDGKTLLAGAVANIRGVKNPVLLSRAIMEKSEHVFLAGAGAEEFARSMNIQFETDEYFFVQHRFDQYKESLAEGKIKLDHSDKKFGTVGAVACDVNGNLAAATSTGGMTNKRFNRIGDSPVIGAGTYANNSTCAVSCTGHGEYFLRTVVAYDISCLMEYKGHSLAEACEIVVNKKLVNLGGEGGVIAVDSAGNFSLTFNSEGMYRGWMTQNEEVVKIYR